MYILGITPGEGLDRARWKRVLDCGIDALSIREKQLEPRALLDCVRWVQDSAPNLPVWVVGRLDVALAAGCGLHAPEAYPEIPHGLVPLSRPLHDPVQFKDRLSANQLLVAPVFPVPGKGPAWGPARLRSSLDALPANPPQAACRILALGGITPHNVAQVKHPHLRGVATMRSLWKGPDPERAVEQLRAAWEG
jgi:thiamine monophosphate synthase